MHSRPLKQAGAVLVEFTLGLLTFWMVLIGVIEFSRSLLTWNLAHEAVRQAARMGSVCENTLLTQVTIMGKLRYLVMAVGQVDVNNRLDWLAFEYFPQGCTNSNCELMKVSLNNVRLQFLFGNIPGIPVDLQLPAMPVTVVRESMRSYMATTSNPTNLNDLCK